MKNIAAKFERYIASRESLPSTAAHIIAVLLFISIVRLGLERLPTENIEQMVLPIELIIRLAFYTGTFFLFFAFAAPFFPQQTDKIRSVVLLGMFGSLFPPFFTALLAHGPHGSYSYFNTFVWHFFSPEQPVGESIGLWLTIAIVGIYFLYRKKSLLYMLAGLVGAYVILQFSGWFLTIPTIFIAQMLQHTAASTGVLLPFSINFLWIVVSLACLLLMRRRFFRATLKRFPHTLMRGILVIAGAQIAKGVTPLTLVDGIMFMIGFMLIQAENDYYDKGIDGTQSRASLITGDDLIFVRFFMLLLVLNLYIIQPALSILMGLFFLLGFMYNHPLFRLKKHFIGSSFVEGSAAFVGLLAGILSVQQSVSGAEILWVSLLSAIFALVSNIKDYKDVDADRKAGIETLHVALDARGIPPEKTQAWIICLLIAAYAGMLAWSFTFVHLPMPLILLGAVFLGLSFLPLLMLNHPKKSASSVAAVFLACIFIGYLSLWVFPHLPGH